MLALSLYETLMQINECLRLKKKEGEREREKHNLHLSSLIPSMTEAETSRWKPGTLP
jgi:hypothetical protein